jgi:hypothetical protein
MKSAFFIAIVFGIWMNFRASGQIPVPPAAKPPVAPTKALAVKNPFLVKDRKNLGWGPMSVGGPAKATRGTGAIVGTAGAHKH